MYSFVFTFKLPLDVLSFWTMELVQSILMEMKIRIIFLNYEVSPIYFNVNEN
jgi:hypothetical protein